MVNVMAEEGDLQDILTRRIPDSECDGILEEIILKNFMCHSELSIDNLAGHKITFITGPNGSGKSAVLTALMLGFGGRANITCRGSSTKGFVKEGKLYAEIQLKLKNDTAFGSFQRDKFGRAIYLRRRLSPSGTSQYSLLNDKRKPVYQSASALKKVMNFFDIRVENPFLLLTQENAKKLLFDATDKDLYKFFRTGTGLDCIESRMHCLKKEAERVRHNWQMRVDVFNKRKRDVAAVERRYERYRQVENLQQRERELQQSLEWADLAQKERDLVGLQEQVARVRRQKDDADRKKETARRCFEDFDKRVAEQQAEVTAAAAETENVKGDVTTAQARLKETIFDFKKVEADVALRNRKLAQLISQKNDIIRAVDATQKKLRAKQGADAERQRNEARLGELQRQKGELENSLKQETAGRQELTDRLATLRQTEQKLRQTENELRRELDGLQRQRALNENMKNNSVGRLGRMIPAILHEIDEAVKRGEFRRQPIGPLGRFVSLSADDHWAPAIESVLRNVATAFVCSCNADKNVFHNIMRKLRVQPSSSDYPRIVSSDRPLGTGRVNLSTTRAVCPNSNLSSFFDLAEISNDDAFNFIVELSGVESKLFAEDAFKAMDLANAGRCQQTSEIIAKNLDKVAIKAQGTNFYANQYPVRAAFLMKNVEKQIADTRQQEQEYRQRYQEVKPQLDKTSREVCDTDGTLCRLDATAARITDRLRSIDYEIERISRLAASVFEEPDDAMLLTEDLQRKEAEIEAFKASQETAVLDARLKAAVDQRKAAEREVEEARAVLSRAEGAHELAEERAAEIHRTLVEARRKLPALRDQADKINTQYETLAGQAQESAEAVQEMLNTLLDKFGSRPRTRSSETRRDIEHALKDLRDKIADRERIDRTGFENIQETLQSLKEQERDIKQKDTQLEQLEYLIDRRIRCFPEMIQRTARHIEAWFSKMSYTKDLNSHLKFDHNNRALSIRVTATTTEQPKQRRLSSSQSTSSFVSTGTPSSSTATSRSVKTLSGGERSMSTVFLLLSLWEHSQCPIKGMDEFDVFLDGENRERAISLINFVGGKMEGQFFLLSPCNVSTLGGPNTRNHLIELRKGGGHRGANHSLSQIFSPALSQTANPRRRRLTQSQTVINETNDNETAQEESTRPKRLCKMEPIPYNSEDQS